MNRRIYCAVAAAIMLPSCTGQSLETTFTSQDSKIDSYIENMTLNVVDPEGNPVLDENGNPMTIKPEVVTNNGCHRVIVNEGGGDVLSAGGSANIYYAGYIFTSSPSSLFATNRKEIAEQAGWKDAEFGLLSIDMDDKNIVTGLRNAIEGARAGEECFIFFSGKYGFGKRSYGIIPANSALCYRIWIDSVSN